MNCPHCEIEISVHPASNCLDAWVAEAVMEWEWWIEYRFVYPEGEPVREEMCRWLLESSYADSLEMDPKFWEKANDFKPTENCVLRPLKLLSTDISAAWEIVEKLGHVSIYSPQAPIAAEYMNEKDIWEVECLQVGMLPSEWRYRSVRGKAPSAPLAICRAALRAVEALYD